MYNTIHEEDKVYEGKKKILKKDKMLKTYLVLTTQFSKQQSSQECLNNILSYGFESTGSKNISKKLVKMIVIA